MTSKPTSRTSDSDEDLIHRLREGDGAALRDLHRRHYNPAFSVAFRALRDRALAEDAVQEAFLDLWRGAAKFDPTRAKLATWVCVLAHRRAVDIARREARRRTLLEPVEVPATDSYTTEELVVLREERSAVQCAVARLSPRQRDVIELAYYAGLTQAEIAARLEIPLGTVKSRVFDALRALKDRLPTLVDVAPRDVRSLTPAR